MIISIRKRGLIFLLAVIVVVAICFGTLIGNRVAQATSPIYEHTIVIDAGHGGIDGGVVGASGIKESDINLKMSKILEKELTSRNFGVVMTRQTEEALNNVKRLDMQARKKIINEANPTAVISLHVNKFSDKSRRGVQVFYDDSGIGKDFATLMQNHLNENINAVYGNRSNYEPIAGDLFITKCAKVPSIIIECGFISNPEDEKLLLSQDFCEDLCKRIGEVMTNAVAASASAGNATEERECLGELTVLMYHNTLAPNKKESVYCINQNHLRKDFEYLKTHGYNVVSCNFVIKSVREGQKLPSKAVLLTFDDGYLNNIKYAQPLLEEYGYSGLFSVVGDYTRLDRTNNPHGGDFTYFGWQDMADANSSEYVEIGLHSYAMHNTGPRIGVSKLSGETSESYKKILSDDTDKLVEGLKNVGVSSNVYAYPYGKYCKESEEVLKAKGILMTLTCNEGTNHIYGMDDLYLLKRYNRDATKGELSSIGKM